MHPRLANARRTRGRVLAAFVLIWAGGTVALANPVGADVPATVSARSQSYRPRFRAFAQVVPIQRLVVRAGRDGVIEDLAVVPGQRLEAGDTIAHIGGPRQRAAMESAKAAVSAAEQELRAAKDAERSTKHIYPGFADRRQLDQAKARLAAAKANLADARARLSQVQSLSTLTSPAAGTVVALRSASGETVSRDTAVIAMQPAHDLWLRALFYDVPATVLTTGEQAMFEPADTGKSLSVHLIHVLPSLRSDGGLPVVFQAAKGVAPWRGGERGEVVVQGSVRSAVAVPTDALILDKGHWWVLVKNSSGDHPTQVVPGPSRGDETLLVHGLAPGAEVVVRNAYLTFHRDFGQHYMPPD